MAQLEAGASIGCEFAVDDMLSLAGGKSTLILW